MVPLPSLGRVFPYLKANFSQVDLYTFRDEAKQDENANYLKRI